MVRNKATKVLTDNESRFCELVLEGKAPGKAYAGAYPHTSNDKDTINNVRGNRLLDEPHIRKFVDDVKRRQFVFSERLAERSAITIEYAVTRVVEIAEASDNDFIKLKAWELVLKAKGAFIQKHDVNVGGSVEIVRLERPSNGRIIAEAVVLEHDSGFQSKNKLIDVIKNEDDE